MNTHLITLTLLFPIFGLLGISCISMRDESSIRSVTIWTTVFTFLLAIVNCFFIEKNIHFDISIFSLTANKMSLYFMALVSFVTLVSALISRKEITKCVKIFSLCLIGLESALFFIFSNEDVLMFYALFELCLLLVFMLLRIFTPSIAKKFFTLQTVVSFFMVFGISYLIHISGLNEVRSLSRYTFTLSQERVIFWTFMIAFITQSAIFPLHCYTRRILFEVPTSLSIVISGIFNKVCMFFILFIVLPIVPHACALYQMTIMCWCVVAVFCSTIGMIFFQKLKQTAANIDIASSAVILFGAFTLNTAGAAGALLCTGAFSITISALFYFAHLVNKYCDDSSIQVSSVMHRMPKIAFLAEIPILSIAAVPLLPCFLGEFTILSACFDAHLIACCFFSAILLIFSFFSFGIFQRTIFGEKVNPVAVSRYDSFILSLLSVVILAFGLGAHFVSKFAVNAINETPIREMYKNVSI